MWKSRWQIWLPAKHRDRADLVWIGAYGHWDPGTRAPGWAPTKHSDVLPSHSCQYLDSQDEIVRGGSRSPLWQPFVTIAKIHFRSCQIFRVAVCDQLPHPSLNRHLMRVVYLLVLLLDTTRAAETIEKSRAPQLTNKTRAPQNTSLSFTNKTNKPPLFTGEVPQCALVCGDGCPDPPCCDCSDDRVGCECPECWPCPRCGH